MESDRWSKPEPKSPCGTNLTEDPTAMAAEELKFPARPVVARTSTPRFEEQSSELNLINLNGAVVPVATLPQYKLHVPFFISCNQISEVFLHVSRSRSFQVIEQANNLATAVYKEKMSIKELFSCCLVQPRGGKMVSAVRLHIGVNEKKCKRTVLVKGIYGAPEVVMAFLNAFKEAMEAVANSPQKNSRSSSAKSIPDVQYEAVSSEKTLEEEDSSLTIKNESASYYQFHKILSSEAYSLGKTIANFVTTFLSQHRNPRDSAASLPVPVTHIQMENVKTLIEDTVTALFSHFNFGKSNTEKIMQFCRPAVEKFVFTRLYPTLFGMYQEQNKETDEGFARKQRDLRRLSPVDLLTTLEVRDMQIKEKYRLGAKPYSESIAIISKLQDLISPMEKLNCLLMSVASLKTAVVDFWRGKEELEAMDDLLPILIYMLVSSTIVHPAAQIHMLQDYVGRSSRYENEARLLINFEVSIKYVAFEWPSEGSRQ